MWVVCCVCCVVVLCDLRFDGGFFFVCFVCLKDLKIFARSSVGWFVSSFKARWRRDWMRSFSQYDASEFAMSMSGMK